MVKSIARILAVGFVGVALALAALYQFAGLRPGFDGTGLMPRFASTGPDYDALEADRISQRSAAPRATSIDGAKSGDGTALTLPTTPVRDPRELIPPASSPLSVAEPAEGAATGVVIRSLRTN